MTHSFTDKEITTLIDVLYVVDESYEDNGVEIHPMYVVKRLIQKLEGHLVTKYDLLETTETYKNMTDSMGEVEDTISLFYDDACNIEDTLYRIRIQLEQAKIDRNTHFDSKEYHAVND